MLPSDKEKDYIFIALIHYYSSRLVDRHLILFKSIVKSIKPNRPHIYSEQIRHQQTCKIKEFLNKWKLKMSAPNSKITVKKRPIPINKFTLG